MELMVPIGPVLQVLGAMVVPTIQAEEALMIGGETKNIFGRKSINKRMKICIKFHNKDGLLSD